MTYPRLLGTIAITLGLVAGQQHAEDPVMKVRAQRAQEGGDQDLPAVPRTVMEPPPLPPPEVHVKDTRGYRGRRVKRGRKGKASATKKPTKSGKAPKSRKPAPRKK